MKRALVLSLAVILGLGVGAFGQITGYWSTTLGIDPQPLAFTSMASTLKVDYALSGWTFGSVSTFNIAGFSAQAFKVAGSLGAFTLVTNMKFNPIDVSVRTSSLPQSSSLMLMHDAVYTNGFSGVCPVTYTATTWLPAFSTWDVTIGASIAGVAVEAYVLQDYSAANALTTLNAFYVGGVQTSSLTCASTLAEGMGWRLKVAGSFGAVKVTRYTYFNLGEYTIFAMNESAVWCPAVGKAGVFEIAYAGCNFPFTEEYVLVQGLSFGCATVDAALSILCGGFANVELVVSNIALGNWGQFSFGITFTTNHKSVATCITLTPLAGPCFTVEIGGFQGTKLESLELYGFKFASTFGGVKFTSITELSAASELMSSATDYTWLNGDEVGFLVPSADLLTCATTSPVVAATYHAVSEGRYAMACVTETKYQLWEKFIIDVDADACCGGLFDLTVSTWFGDQYVLDSYGYFVVLAHATTYGTATTLYGIAPVAPATALTDKAYDRVFPVAHYAVGTQTQLFNWAKTDVALAVGIGSNVSLSAGFNLSVYGWDKITFGFKWSF